MDTLKLRTPSSSLITMLFLGSIIFALPSLFRSLQLSCVNVLLDHALYDTTLSQLTREVYLNSAINCIPKEKHFTVPVATTQEEALLFADLQRKQGIISVDSWQQVLKLPSADKWPSFRLPSNLFLSNGEVLIPFDTRWHIFTTRQRIDSEWLGTDDIATSLLASDENVLQVMAENGVEYELLVLRWNGYTDSGPYLFLNFEIQSLPDTDVGIVVYYGDGQSKQIPLTVNADEWTTVHIPFSPHHTQIQFVDFYASDKNLTKEDRFGLKLRNGKFSY